MYCPDFLIKINPYSCAKSLKFLLPSKCKTGLECWNKEFVNSEEEAFTLCPSHISCPFNKIKIKCFDNSCVDHREDFLHYLECPSFNPIRCPNGDYKDCPIYQGCTTSGE